MIGTFSCALLPIQHIFTQNPTNNKINLEIVVNNAMNYGLRNAINRSNQYIPLNGNGINIEVWQIN